LMLLMLAVMITTLFTEAFSLTLIWGLPFLGVMTLIYVLRFRAARPVAGEAPTPLPLRR